MERVKIYFSRDDKVEVPSINQQSTRADVWFSRLAQQLNDGLSFHELTITHPDLYLTSLAATAISAHVAYERENGEEGTFTRLERKLLKNWEVNRERELNGQPEQSLPIQIAEFVGAELIIKNALERVIQHIRQNVRVNLPENPVIDTLIASLIAKNVPTLLHNNAITLEKLIAINATKVDPEGLRTVLDNLDRRTSQTVSDSTT